MGCNVSTIALAKQFHAQAPRPFAATPREELALYGAADPLAALAELGLERVAEQRGWEALRAIGWTIQRPRPRHARAAGPEEQAAFKKSSPRLSPRRRSATPAQ